MEQGITSPSSCLLNRSIECIERPEENGATLMTNTKNSIRVKLLISSMKRSKKLKGVFHKKMRTYIAHLGSNGNKRLHTLSAIMGIPRRS